MKKIEIFIVCIVLFLLAFVAGCDDDPVYGEQEVQILDLNDIDITWEPDYPIGFRLYGQTMKEPVTFELGKNCEIVCDATRERWRRVLYESLSGKEPNQPVIIKFKEVSGPKE